VIIKFFALLPRDYLMLLVIQV